MTTHTPAADDPIVVEGLAKTYQVTDREGGFGAAVKSFVKRKYKDVKAVQNVSFRIGQGEIVGFLGPNGAGKTTTLKMLSGLLHPTGGKAIVLGHTPWNREAGFLSAMTLVMGQRNRLSWDIPAADSFLLNQAIYRISDTDYKSVFGELNDLLDLKDIMRKPVRQLSLGERMKCELAAALLHFQRRVQHRRIARCPINEKRESFGVQPADDLKAFTFGHDNGYRERQFSGLGRKWQRQQQCCDHKSYCWP